jgi:hypothetical protein
MQTFSDIAADYALQADGERDQNRRADFQEAAHFYGALAQIIPTFPGGYTQYFDAAATNLDNRAEECRAMAAVVGDAECQAKLLRLAKTYQKVSDAVSILASRHLEASPSPTQGLQPPKDVRS